MGKHYKINNHTQTMKDPSASKQTEFNYQLSQLRNNDSILSQIIEKSLQEWIAKLSIINEDTDTNTNTNTDTNQTQIDHIKKTSKQRINAKNIKENYAVLGLHKALASASASAKKERLAIQRKQNKEKSFTNNTTRRIIYEKLNTFKKN